MAVLKTTMTGNVIEVMFGTDTGTWAWNDTSSWSSDTTGAHIIQNGYATLPHWNVESLTFHPSSGGDHWNIFDGSTAGPLAYSMPAADYGDTLGIAHPKSEHFAGKGLRLRPVFSKATSTIVTTNVARMVFTLK